MTCAWIKTGGVEVVWYAWLPNKSHTCPSANISTCSQVNKSLPPALHDSPQSASPSWPGERGSALCSWFTTGLRPQVTWVFLTGEVWKNGPLCEGEETQHISLIEAENTNWMNREAVRISRGWFDYFYYVKANIGCLQLILNVPWHVGCFVMKIFKICCWFVPWESIVRSFFCISGKAESH